MSAQAGMIAKTGFSMLYNATVTSVSAISGGINKAYKSYNDHYEKSQLESLRKSGKPPSDVLHQVLIKFYFLSEAGYNNELAAAAQKIAAKLTSGEKSAVSPECVGALSNVLVTSCSKYGEFSSGGWGLSDFLNSARMGKDHYDRDQLVTDFYFAIIYAQDMAGGPGPQFEKYIQDAAGKMVEGEGYASDGGPSGGAGWASFGSGGLPSYAQAGGFGSTSAAGAKTSSSAVVETDPKKKRAKVLCAVTMSLKKAADEAESKRIRSLKEAEEMLHRERMKAAQAGGAPPAAYGSGTSSGFGGAAPSVFGSGSSFGTAKPAAPSGFGSSTFGGAPAAGGSSGFGGYGAPAPATGSSGFGSGSASGWGSSGSTFGSASGSSGGSGSTFGSGGGMMGFGSGGGGYSNLASTTSSEKPGQGSFGSLI